MRPTQNRRMRGRSRSKGPNPLTRSYESNGPDVKVRGTAQHVADKYGQLARDAQASGDPVAAEAYFQHAEHYYRIIAAAQEALRQQYGGTRSFDEDGDEGEDDNNGFAYHSHDRSGHERHDRSGNGASDDYDPGSQPQPQFQPAPYEQRGERQDRGQDRGDRSERGFAPRGERQERGERQDRGNDRSERGDRQDRGDRPPRGDRRERFQRPPMEQRAPVDARRDPREDPDFAPRREDARQPRRDEQPRREEVRREEPRREEPRREEPRREEPRREDVRAEEQPRVVAQPPVEAPTKPARAPRARRVVETSEQPGLPDFLTKPVSRPAPAETEASAPGVADEGEAPKPKRRRATRRAAGDETTPEATDKSAAE